MTIKYYDVQTAYKNGELPHEVYMMQPEGYDEKSKQLAYKLNKNVYSQKQGANGTKSWTLFLLSLLTPDMTEVLTIHVYKSDRKTVIMCTFWGM